MNFQALVLIGAVFASATTMVAGVEPQYIVRERPTDRGLLPFSDAVLTGNTLYIAGHIGIDAKTGQAARDPEVEATLVLDAVKQTVKAAGLTMDDLVSVTVFCTDLGLYHSFNKIYQSYFHEKYPARAFIGVGHLLRGAHFEVQGVAVKSHPSG